MPVLMSETGEIGEINVFMLVLMSEIGASDICSSRGGDIMTNHPSGVVSNSHLIAILPIYHISSGNEVRTSFSLFARWQYLAAKKLSFCSLTFYDAKLSRDECKVFVMMISSLEVISHDMIF